MKLNLNPKDKAIGIKWNKKRKIIRNSIFLKVVRRRLGNEINGSTETGVSVAETRWMASGRKEGRGGCDASGVRKCVWVVSSEELLSLILWKVLITDVPLDQ